MPDASFPASATDRRRGPTRSECFPTGHRMPLSNMPPFLLAYRGLCGQGKAEPGQVAGSGAVEDVGVQPGAKAEQVESTGSHVGEPRSGLRTAAPCGYGRPLNSRQPSARGFRSLACNGAIPGGPADTGPTAPTSTVINGRFPEVGDRACSLQAVSELARAASLPSPRHRVTRRRADLRFSCLRDLFMPVVQPPGRSCVCAADRGGSCARGASSAPCVIPFSRGLSLRIRS